MAAISIHLTSMALLSVVMTSGCMTPHRRGEPEQPAAPTAGSPRLSFPAPYAPLHQTVEEEKAFGECLLRRQRRTDQLDRDLAAQIQLENENLRHRYRRFVARAALAADDARDFLRFVIRDAVAYHCDQLAPNEKKLMHARPGRDVSGQPNLATTAEWDAKLSDSEIALWAWVVRRVRAILGPETAWLFVEFFDKTDFATLFAYASDWI